MENLNIIVVNYNYADYLLRHLNQFEKVFDRCKDWVIVDDQSDQGDLFKLNKVFDHKVISTRHTKSTSNSINQLRAIRTGLEKLSLNTNEFYWVIDADDIPYSIPSKISDDVTFYSYQENGKLKSVIKRHSLWFTGSITSGIVVKGSILDNYSHFIFEEKFVTVWYDMRVSMIASLRSTNAIISENVLFDHVIHGFNDSAVYKGNRIKLCKRLIVTCFKRLTL